MDRGSADIRSPEVIRRFRARFVAFDEQAAIALGALSGDIGSTQQWLTGEQLPYWRLQFRRRHEEMKDAWRDYVNARYGDRRMGKPSSVDERKIWERAKQRRAEAEEKILVVEGWIAALEREANRLMPPCRRFDAVLLDRAPKALARLDHMLDHLDEYMRPSAPAPE